MNTFRETKTEQYGTLAALLIFMAAGYFLLSDLMGGTLFAPAARDSYTLQTWNWLHGRMYVENGEHYEWLELAIYNGKYYVSFPPLPSVVLLPLVLIFGTDTPATALVGIYGLVSAALAFEIMCCRGRTPRAAAFWALFTVWGSNMLWMTTDGSVWFQAQALNMVLCLAAVLAAVKEKRPLSTTLLALGVGCRPLSAVFLPVFYLWFAWEDRKKENGYFRALLKQWKCIIGPVIVAACLMAYNYARFGNPLEFGHNYLPEHTRSETGQFNIIYFLPNLRHLLFRPVTVENGRLSFTLFSGFMFYVANPLYMVLMIRQGKNLFRRNVSGEGLLLAGGITLELCLLCLHVTMGGWQFGARYTCDMLPFALLYIADRGQSRLKVWEALIGGLAVAFNLYGTIFLFLYG